MGTRGLFGFYWKGKFYVVYNHWDSYPSGLGAKILLEILDADLEKWKELLEQIVIVDQDVEPTKEQIERLKPYTDLSVSNQSTSDWYCLLRHCQGSITRVLQSGHIVNAVDTDNNPDFQEYAYVVNFDQNTLDFYRGTNDKESFDLSNQTTLRKLHKKWKTN